MSSVLDYKERILSSIDYDLYKEWLLDPSLFREVDDVLRDLIGDTISKLRKEASNEC